MALKVVWECDNCAKQVAVGSLGEYCSAELAPWDWFVMTPRPTSVQHSFCSESCVKVFLLRREGRLKLSDANNQE